MDELHSSTREPMLDMYLFECNTLLEQLEEIILNGERKQTLGEDCINEIFRIMHTIKGSSGMMMFNNISSVSHKVEDLFFFIRDNKPGNLDYDLLFGCVLESVDFIKNEISKIERNLEPDGIEDKVVVKIQYCLAAISESSDVLPVEKPKPVPEKFYISSYGKSESGGYSKKFHIRIFFEDGSQMENVRAYTIVHNITDICNQIYHRPMNILEDPLSCEYIVEYGFEIYLETKKSKDDVDGVLKEACYVKGYEITELEEYISLIGDLLESDEKEVKEDKALIVDNSKSEEKDEIESKDQISKSIKQNLINVNVTKLDMLMDLVGEIVISESMVIKNPDLIGMDLENFSKSARHLKKLTDELQDIVMSIRMIPIAATFHKMTRLVRDMNKKMGKLSNLQIIGEETEVDKNIIENLSDPLMHLIRNSMDHGIELPDEREANGKNKEATLILEARNTGSDVVITIFDDGRGLEKDKILTKARESGLITKPEHELTDKEIFSFILLPGFSTKEQVTEFSGRGVGMDVVMQNIENVGGSIHVDSIPGKSTTITIKIPLTLAIIDGMQIAVGKSIYTLPTIAIKESFRPEIKDIIIDPDGNEMIMIRGNCYPIVRIHEKFSVETDKTHLSDGIITVIENEKDTYCLYSDKLLGEQQAVVKPLPSYISKYNGRINGVGGCTILGDGSISLIIDVNTLNDYN